MRPPLTTEKRVHILQVRLSDSYKLNSSTPVYDYLTKSIKLIRLSDRIVDNLDRTIINSPKPVEGKFINIYKVMLKGDTYRYEFTID